MTILSRVRLMYSLYIYILQICCDDCLAVDRVKSFTTNVNLLICSWSSDWDQGPIHCSNKIWKMTFVVKGPLQPPNLSSVDWETDAMERIQFFLINIPHNASKMKQTVYNLFTFYWSIHFTVKSTSFLIFMTKSFMFHQLISYIRNLKAFF